MRLCKNLRVSEKSFTVFWLYIQILACWLSVACLAEKPTEETLQWSVHHHWAAEGLDLNERKKQTKQKVVFFDLLRRFLQVSQPTVNVDSAFNLIYCNTALFTNKVSTWPQFFWGDVWKGTAPGLLSNILRLEGFLFVCFQPKSKQNKCQKAVERLDVMSLVIFAEGAVGSAVITLTCLPACLASGGIIPPSHWRLQWWSWKPGEERGREGQRWYSDKGLSFPTVSCFPDVMLTLPPDTPGKVDIFITNN